MISYPNYKLYVAVIKNNIIGSFALLIMINLGHMGAPSGILEDVVVAPNYHGQGVGRKRVNYAKTVCKEKGCYKLLVSSNMKRKDAHAFYESIKFQKHGFSFLVDL
jgi:GNAT superfamily N-acetyltransferase